MKIKFFALTLLLSMALIGLTGCGNRERLKKDEYNLSKHGSTYTITVLDDDDRDISYIKVRYTYTRTLPELNLAGTGLKTEKKTVTETIENKQYGTGFYHFYGTFTVPDDTTELEIKTVRADFRSPEKSSKPPIIYTILTALALDVICWILYALLGLFPLEMVARIVHFIYFICVVGTFIGFGFVRGLIMCAGYGIFFFTQHLLFEKLSNS